MGKHKMPGNPEVAAVIQELSGKLNAWMEEQGDQGAQAELDAKYRCTKLEGKAWKKTPRDSQ